MWYKNCLEYWTAKLSNFTFRYPVNVFFASIDIKIDQTWLFVLNALLGNEAC